uniref:Uncharacterized protein n=1 Tax=Glossina pallidipes TaxID=7398 RepID=A0A1A9Z2X0_GLOPL
MDLNVTISLKNLSELLKFTFTITSSGPLSAENGTYLACQGTGLDNAHHWFRPIDDWLTKAEQPNKSLGRMARTNLFVAKAIIGKAPSLTLSGSQACVEFLLNVIGFFNVLNLCTKNKQQQQLCSVTSNQIFGSQLFELQNSSMFVNINIFGSLHLCLLIQLTVLAAKNTL